MSRAGSAALALAVTSITAAPETVRFSDVAREARISWVHENAATPAKYMVETMGSGGGFLDYDGDGDLDVYLVNGAALAGARLDEPPPGNALYRNDGNGVFTDVTAAAGVAGSGFGMGLAAGDVDNDGDVDLYLTHFGPNILYRNNGDGTFTDVTAAAGVAASGWSASAAFADYDGDGFLDLFVCRYVDFSLDNHKFCGDLARNIRAYCHPHIYLPVPNLLFHNQGDGTFTDVTERAGVHNSKEGKSLGVVWGDYDNDGDLDLYVANDTMRNFLYRNDGGGRFTDVTLEAGVGYGEDGKPQAGMGTDIADYDGDGLLDLFVTNFDFEYNALYRGGPGGVFTDESYPSGVAEPSLNFLGFGTFFFDFDNDGELDLFVANGHILDNIERFDPLSTYRERNFLFRNEGRGRFREISKEAGAPFAPENVGRGAAPGDFDGDGDEDLLLTRCGEAPALLRNEGGNRNEWIALKLFGRLSNRDAVGARVTVSVGERRRFKEIKAGLSYLSQGSLEVLFGLGSETGAEVEVRWPSGEVENLGRVPSRTRLTVLEGRGPL